MRPPRDEIGVLLWICSVLDDIVLRKLVRYRLGGGLSERQLRDVAGVLKVCGEELDREYLRRWARDLEVLDLLEGALGEA